MTTSGTYTFSVSRDDIILEAMLNIKRVDPDEGPTASETRDCARKLNMLVKQWMGKSDFAPGLKVWTRKTFYLMLNGTSGTYAVGPSAPGWCSTLSISSVMSPVSVNDSYVTVGTDVSPAAGWSVGVQDDAQNIEWFTITSVSGQVLNLSGLMVSTSAVTNKVYLYPTGAQKPLNIETAWLRDDTNSDTPLTVMNVQDWSNLPNKQDPTDEGDPTAIYYEEGISSGTIYTDVGSAQDVTKYIMIKGMEPVQDFNNPLDTPYYPQEWYMALSWGLSKQIAPMFGATWSQIQETLYQESLMIARNKGSENSSLYFQPGQE